MSAAQAWLRGRRPAPPERLARRIEEAVARVAPAVADVPAALGEAAMTCLDASLGAGPGRGAALDLLAADALLTYAWEAAAEAGAASLDAFAASFEPARFEALLPGAG